MRRRVLVRDLILMARVGVYSHEIEASQRLCINLDLEVAPDQAHEDRLENVVCYERLVLGVKKLLGQGHVNLVETLADRIADLCLTDPRVRLARVRVEKLDVLAEATAVGVEIERQR